jgi:hypothetical protein
LKIIERYASAVRSSNLRSKEATTYSDPDVIGAFGLAAKTEPLGAALHRLFTGDNRAAQAVIEALSGKLMAHFPTSLTESESLSVAGGVLKWNQSNVCPHCKGRGSELIQGSPTLSDRECKHCRGTGKKLFEKQFHRDKIKYADWAQLQIDIALPAAGQAAMKSIAASLDL